MLSAKSRAVKTGSGLKLKALTVQQPWAWMIAEGRKTVENRTWSTRYRGPLVIQAGKSRSWLDRMDQGGAWRSGAFAGVPEQVGSGLFSGAGGAKPRAAGVLSGLHFGAALCVVDVVDCLPVDQCPPSAFVSGPWCLVLENVRRLSEPLPMLGMPGMFDMREAEVAGLRDRASGELLELLGRYV